MLSTRHPPLLNWRLMLGGDVVTLYTSPNITTAQQHRARGRQKAQDSGLGLNFPLIDFPLHVYCRIKLRKYGEHYMDSKYYMNSDSSYKMLQCDKLNFWLSFP